MKSRLVIWLVVLISVLVAGPVSAQRDPVGPVRMIAEWEPAAGTLIRWPLGIPMSLVRELAEDDLLYTLVEGTNNENNARTTFQNGGVNMTNVQFIQAQVYSMWTRDWGPQCVFDGTGQMGITDPWFDGYPWVPGCAKDAAPPAANPRTEGRAYDEDDVINGTVAAALGLPLHGLPAYCTGGNIMTDGQGVAFSTQQMLDENAPHMSAATFFAAAEAYLGISRYEIVDNPEVHGIQHIDCYAKLVDEETVVVKEVPTWHPEYDCVEGLAATFAATNTCYGRPYDVRRIWCEPYSGNRAAAYTNSLILNRKVLVPTFGLAADADALETYRQAMPGYEVVGFDYGSWYDYDALHCRTMAIFDAGMLRLTHRPLDAIVPPATTHEILAVIDDRSEAGLAPGAQTVHWRLTGQTTWNAVPLTPTIPDSFTADIPGQTPGTVVEYYLAATDLSGRNETLPRTAPDGFYAFQVDPDLSSAPAAVSGLHLQIQPNPSNPRSEIRFDLPAPGPVHLSVFDLRGRQVATLADDVRPAGPHSVTWSGRTDSGAALTSGSYLINLKFNGHVQTKKIMILK